MKSVEFKSIYDRVKHIVRTDVWEEGRLAESHIRQDISRERGRRKKSRLIINDIFK